jgi:hypothetical protein
MRLTGARVATIGAWLGAVDAGAADSAVHRARAIPGAESSPVDRIELRWLDGLVGVSMGDEARVRAAMRELLTDTARASRYSARSLAGLWLERSSPDIAADSLRALSDDVMRDGGFLLSVESVGRFVVARALRKRGAAADVDRYLMWSDAGVNTARNISVAASLGALVVYERGVAFDEIGDRDAATHHLRRFLERYDRPPDAHVALVEDAKKRLARLEKGDAAPAAKAVR